MTSMMRKEIQKSIKIQCTLNKSIQKNTSFINGEVAKKIEESVKIANNLMEAFTGGITKKEKPVAK